MKRVVGDPEDPRFHRYLGLDLSLTGTGLVSLENDGQVVHEKVVGQSLKRDALVREKIERIVYLAGYVLRVVKFNSFEVHEFVAGKESVWKIYPRVGIENYAFGVAFSRKKKPGGGGNTFDLGELGGVVKTQLWLSFKIEPYMIASTSARKHVFGDGRLKKKDVIPRLKAMGINFKNHNIADAYVVAEALRMMKATSRAGNVAKRAI